MIAPAAETRFCEQCVSMKPVSEFRRRSPNGTDRQNECRTCHNEAERSRRARKRVLRDDNRMSAALTRLNNERSNKRVELLVRAMSLEFGGVKGVVAAWKKYYDHAIANPGSFANLRCVQAIFRLLEYLAERPEPDLGELTDEELARSTRDSAKKLISAEPEWMVATLRDHGWIVVPATDAPSAESSSIPDHPP